MSNRILICERERAIGGGWSVDMPNGKRHIVRDAKAALVFVADTLGSGTRIEWRTHTDVGARVARALRSTLLG